MYQQESKGMSYFLRHAAEKAGIPYTSDGYVLCTDLITAMNKKFPNFSQEIMEQIVREDEKARYTFSADGKSIRASQGHSMKVNLKLPKAIPPVTLYHGTDSRGFAGIQKTGIQRMKRHHVHLTEDLDTASSVGIRHGSEVVIEIDTRDMVKDKVVFYRSDNGVWLTDYVDIKYFKNVTRKK